MSVFDRYSRQNIRKAVIDAYDKECQYCREELPPSQLHLDHIRPVSENGDDCLDNITLACQTCNLKKSNALLEEPGASLLKAIVQQKKPRILRKLKQQAATSSGKSADNGNSNKDNKGESRERDPDYRWCPNMEAPKFDYLLDISIPVAHLDERQYAEIPYPFLPVLTLDEFNIMGYRFHLPLPLDVTALSLLQHLLREWEWIRLSECVTEYSTFFGEYEKQSSGFSVQLSGLTNPSVESANRLFEALNWLMDVNAGMYGRSDSGGWVTKENYRLVEGWTVKRDQPLSHNKTLKYYHPQKSEGQCREAILKCIDSNPAEVLASTEVSVSNHLTPHAAECLKQAVEEDYSHLIREHSSRAA